MPWHRVERGEWMGSIATRYGYKTWEPIWNRSENASLRAERGDPELLQEGDRVFVPVGESKTKDGATELRHRFVTRQDDARFRIRFIHVQGLIDTFGPIAYSLELGTNRDEGNVSSEGQEASLPIPLGLKLGTLVFGGISYELHIGALDPLRSTSGMQARLRNVGFDAGPIDNVVGPLTRRGTRQFQDFYAIQVDGIIGPETRGKMKEVYGC
jgi:hypothetical protein